MYSPYSPASPYDRIYTTPDVSLPSVKEILQRIRLENVLRRSGLLPCCKTFWHPTDITQGVYVPHQTNVEPFGVSERQCCGPKSTKSVKGKGNKIANRDQQNDSVRYTDRQNKPPKLPHIKQKQQIPKESECRRHSCWTSRHEVKQPYSVVTAQDNSAVKTAYDVSQEYYRPFYPPKPAKLPNLQKENNYVDKTKTKLLSKDRVKDKPIMRVELERETKKGPEKWKYPENANKRRKRQIRREQEFREWSESHENYYGKPLDFDLYDASLFDSQEKFHDSNVTWKRTQDIYRGDVGLAYVDLGQSTFQRHLLLPKIESKTKGKKMKKTKIVKK